MKLTKAIDFEALNSSIFNLKQELLEGNIKVESLESIILTFQEELKNKDEKIRSLKNAYRYSEEQLDWLKRQIFGKKSERYVSNVNEQQLFFEGFEPAEEIEIEPEQEKKQKKRRKKRKSTGKDKIALPSDLPVKTIIIDLSEKEKVCPITGESLVKIGEEKTYKLAHLPGSYFLKEFVRYKYAHLKKEEAGILIGELPETLLPKCRADESLLADIITKKFADHLPLYRIAESMGREGIKINRRLLSQWVINSANALTPLYNEMLNKVLASNNIFMDETPVRLQGKKKCKQGYMWVVVGGNEADPPYKIFEYREDRCHIHANEILKGYQGVLHSDKYGAYKNIAKKGIVTWCPCWAHIRRKFFEAEAGDPKLRIWVLRKIKYLFLLEKVAWARSEDERLKIRKEQEIPIIDELIAKILEEFPNAQLLPKSKLRTAMSYFLGLVPYLKNYTQNAFSRLDNNVAERAVRPIAIGRKNWMFFGSFDGGKAAGIFFSLIQTCRGLGINPREYLEDVMRKIMSYNSQKLCELLPNQWLANRTIDS